MSSPDKSVTVDLMAGTFAGTCQLIVGHPFDTVKVKMQTQVGKYNGAVDCTKQILSTHGPKGLFKGMSTPLATVAVFNAVLFSARGQMENMLAHADGTPLTLKDQVIAGLGAGVAGSFVACPTELIKCRLQAQSGPRPPRTQVLTTPAPTAAPPVVRYSGPISVAQHVMAVEGGVRGLFRGQTATLLREVPGNAAMFGTYGVVKQAMASAAGLSNPDKLPKSAMLVAGGVAGAAFWLSCYPMDVVKSKIQTDSVATNYYSGTMDCIRKIYRAEGMAGFFRGFGPAMARSVPANAAAFAAYEVAVSTLTPAEPLENMQVQNAASHLQSAIPPA